MQFSGALSWPVIAEIVYIHAVDNVLNASLTAHDVQFGEQLVLAVEAAVRIVLHIIGIIELMRLDVLVPKSTLAGERFGIALVRLGNRGGVRGDRDGIVAESAVRRPGQICG